MATKFGIGQAVRRVEDQRFLTGKGRYVDDINLPHQAYGALVLSPHAHARVKKIDVSKAKAAPGVLLVLTQKEATDDHLGAFTAHLMPEDVGAPKGHRTFQPILNNEKVRFVGDRVAFVVAETLAQARDAAELVEVEYEVLPAVVHLEDAAKDGASKVWDDCPNGNTAFRLMFGNKDKTDAAFAAAKHIVKLRVENNRLAPNAMEPRAAIGDWSEADQSFTLYTTSQNPHGSRMEMSHIFHVSEASIRVISPDVGGGFGLKGGAFPDDGLVLWASKRLGRPVKWVATRAESLLTDHHARELINMGELALDETGKILGLRCHTMFQMGAYFIGAAFAPAGFSQRFIPEAYDIQNVFITLQALFTNTSQTGPYRGAGRPEAAYFTERMVDHAARSLKLDPVEIRRKNLIPTAKLPYVTPTFWTYDSGEFERIMNTCLEAADWKGYAARKAASDKAGKIRGRSITFYIEQGGIFNDRMDLRFDPSGSVTILAGTHSHGQGHATVFAQLVHEWLGVPFDSIRFQQGDTQAVPMGRGTYAARSSLVGSNALKVACEAIVEKGKQMAGALMEAAPADIEFKDGEYRIAGTDKKMGLVDVAKAYYAPMGLTDKLGVGLEAQGSWGSPVPNHPNGAHVCEVEIDPDTGFVSVERYTIVDDVGKALNPLIIEGQVHGGVAQGIGQALVEHAVYDRESGQMLTGSFMDYGMPRADLFPDMKSSIEEIPAKTNPVGVKGIGESGTIGGTQIDMPATPGKVWGAIQAAKGKKAA